jgi:hypothetical protein
VEREPTREGVKLMGTNPTTDAGDPDELSAEDRALLQDPAFREAFLEILTFSKRAKPIRTAADLARRKEQAADVCERFLRATICSDPHSAGPIWRGSPGLICGNRSDSPWLRSGHASD